MNLKFRQITFEDIFSGILGLVIGCVFIGGGFLVGNQVTQERATLKQTQGTVVDSLRRRERDSKDKQKETYAPVVEFLVKGDRIRFTGNYQSSRSSNGKIVAVRYDPKQPRTTARLVDFYEDLLPWMSFGMGGLSLISGLRQIFPIYLSSGDE
ncbi:DUF3592 domain-containing protein [Nostoc parmelioides]|uniref:DUF3592 domain-containing protein n=1 Tax=Nostoc parmelioides FACHB-3921 TaxID=2692909 RepID=A0ABR8B9H8_9NOSO|nr:DUF3592 domain-containing protein [Nostoc parmelioides]MBD2250757.1 DUF3592 domain-containing protein [Nostoc parmelioides FACHB-3921]